MKIRHCSVETKKKISEANKGDKHPFYGKHHSIETRKKMSEARKGSKHYMYGKFGEKSPNWRGGRTKIICKVCGKERYAQTSQVKRGFGSFCSHRCNGIWKVKHQKKRDTDIERLMEAELLKQNIPHLKQVPIEGIALVDFLLPNRIIVQCDGEFWHQLPERKNRDINQDFVLGFKGYKVYRFTNKEIYSQQILTKKLLGIMEEER